MKSFSGRYSTDNNGKLEIQPNYGSKSWNMLWLAARIINWYKLEVDKNQLCCFYLGWLNCWKVRKLGFGVVTWIGCLLVLEIKCKYLSWWEKLGLNCKRWGVISFPRVFNIYIDSSNKLKYLAEDMQDQTNANKDRAVTWRRTCTLAWIHQTNPRPGFRLLKNESYSQIKYDIT